MNTTELMNRVSGSFERDLAPLKEPSKRLSAIYWQKRARGCVTPPPPDVWVAPWLAEPLDE